MEFFLYRAWITETTSPFPKPVLLALRMYYGTTLPQCMILEIPNIGLCMEIADEEQLKKCSLEIKAFNLPRLWDCTFVDQIIGTMICDAKLTGDTPVPFDGMRATFVKFYNSTGGTSTSD